MNEQDPVTRQARALPRSLAPARDLWPDIAARLDDAEPVTETSTSAAPPSARRWLPLAAGLLLALSLAFFWLESTTLSPAPAPVAIEAGPAAAPLPAAALLPAAELRQSRLAVAGNLQRRIAGLKPSTRQVVLDNLAIIDRALDDIDAALEASPGADQDARLLLAMYADQLVLLNTMNNALYPSTPEIAL